MKRRLFSILIAFPTLFLMLGAVPVPLHEANAQTPTAPNVQVVPVGTAIIWCGLWNGSNLNVTDSCAQIGNTDNNPQPSYGYKVIDSSGSSQSSGTVTVNTNDGGSQSYTSSPSYGYAVVNSDGGSSSSQSSGTVAVTTNDGGSQSYTSSPSYGYSVANSDGGSSSSTSPSNSSSQVNVNGQTVPTATAIIWCGLWNGSNFNVTDSCANIGNGSPPASQNQQMTTTSQASAPMAPAQTTSSDPPADPPASKGTYAALGDSVAAGLGLPLPANADAASTACGRSSEGYPNLVAQSMNLTLINVSCSGTTAGDLVTSENVNGVEQQAQLDQAFTNGTPKYMSITAGANDMEWSYFLGQCFVGNCATVENTAAVDALLVSLQAKLHTSLSSIQSRSKGSPPDTAVTGYYQPIGSDCVQSGSKLTANDVTWIQAATSALNQTIMQTAQQYSFAHYVPVSFTGHDACSSDPWVQTVSGSAPFHPTAQGQAVIAGSVEAALGR